MAKPASQRKAEGSTDSAQREEARIVRLLKKDPPSLADHHAIGEALRRLERLATTGTGSTYGTKWLQGTAERVGCSPSKLSKAQQFSEAYGRHEIAELEGLGVGYNWILFALAVKEKGERHRLLREAKEKGRSDRQLQRAIQQHNGSKGPGGRRRKPPSSQGLIADVAELLDRTNRWLEFQEGAWGCSAAAYEGQLEQMQVGRRANLAELLEAAAGKLQQLRSQSEAALTLAESLRAMASPPGGAEAKAKSRRQRKRDEGGE